MRDLFPGITTEPDGSLCYRDYGGSHGYIRWHPLSTHIELDGHYSADDLRRIIAHMEAHRKADDLTE